MSGGGPAAGQLSIISHRDRHGVIHISNVLPQDGQGRSFLGPMASIADLQRKFGAIISEATQTYQLPTSLVLALIQNESNAVPRAVSPKGAMGLMQLMPGTANSLGVRDPFDPRENILAGCRYLRELLDRFEGSLPLAVAAYNAGHHRVTAAGNAIPDIKETRQFVKSTMELYYFMEKTGQGL